MAHYLSLLVVQGQLAIPMASDPFGRGWNPLGTAGYVPDLTPLSPNQTWYVQVGALVGGHVAGLLLAHDQAVGLFRTGGAATRSQFVLLR